MANVLKALYRSSRPAVLPSVLSNIIVGWVFGGGACYALQKGDFLWLILSGLSFYLFGMWGNDVADASWDARHRPERPIPSGMISRGALAVCALLALTLGLYAVPSCAQGAAFALAGAILCYTVLHKRWAGSVLFMGMSRALLILMAFSAASGMWFSLLGAMLWQGELLWLSCLTGTIFLYICSVTLWARKETQYPGRIRQVGFLLSLLPVLDALFLFLTGCWMAGGICVLLYLCGRGLRRIGASAS